jgi:enoyl-CoA hydratase/carnithine racemase
MTGSLVLVPDTASGPTTDRCCPWIIRVLAQAEKPLIAAVPDLGVGRGTTILLPCNLTEVSVE